MKRRLRGRRLLYGSHPLASITLPVLFAEHHNNGRDGLSTPQLDGAAGLHSRYRVESLFSRSGVGYLSDRCLGNLERLGELVVESAVAVQCPVAAWLERAG